MFSPSMLDSIALSLVSGSGVSGQNFWSSQLSSGRSTRSASALASNSSSKPPSTKHMVLPMSMLGSASGNTNTSGGGSTSTSAPPPPPTPPPQPHIGDKDKLVDASALDTFNAADTLAGKMSLHRALLQILTKEMMVILGWQRCQCLLLSLELAAFTLRASRQA